MRFSRAKIFVLFCLSLIVGVFLGEYLNSTIMAIAAMIFIMLITLFWRQKTAMFAGFLGLALLAGAWRFLASFPYDKPDFVGRHYGEEIELEGIVAREPDVRDNRVNLTIEPAAIFVEEAAERVRAEKVRGKVLLVAGRYPEYEYGDRLKISGKLEEPFSSAEFSYKDYLSRFDTYAVMRYPKMEKIASGQGNPLKAALLSFKVKFQEGVAQILPEPQSSLVLGIILGLKRSLPGDLRDALVATGVSHIVVVSGYNISIVAKGILSSRGILGRRIAFLLALLFIAGLVVITGAEASVIRAGLMGSLLILALGVGRIYQADRILIFAATLMILHNPKILRFDIGFQLSFLATLGLIYLSPLLEKWFEKVPNIVNFRGNLSATLAAIVFTLPLLAFYFDRISLIAPLVNILILWAVPYIMTLGALAGMTGILFLPLAKIISWPLWALLSYQIFVVENLARVPFAQASVKINLAAVAAYYLVLGLGLWRLRKSKRFFNQIEYAAPRL